MNNIYHRGGYVRQSLANGRVVDIEINKLKIGDSIVKQPFVGIKEDDSHLMGTVENIRELRTQRVVKLYGRTEEFRYQRATSRVKIMHRSGL
jgi:hypothetical protein